MGGAGGVGGGEGGKAGRWGRVRRWGSKREAFVWILPAQKPTAVFSALPLRGRSRTDMSPVRTGRKAASSKNPAVIFAWGPGKIQTKASTPRPADGGHDRAFYKRALRGGGGGARSDGKRSEVRIQRSGKAPKGRQGGRGRGGGAKRSLKHTGARPVDGARRGREGGGGRMALISNGK